MRYKCKKCNLIVLCRTNDECKKKCREECAKQVILQTPSSVENAFGPMLETYPENLKKMYDDRPNNQPEQYNMKVAIENPVNYSLEQQGLIVPERTNVWR